MLSIETDPKSPIVATILSDLRQIEAPHAVCVAKCRFVFCLQHNAWVRDNAPPDFQEIDCWESIPARQVTDLVPEKKQAELLLRGVIKSMATIFRQDATGIQTIVKVGHLSPEPRLYWQGEWKSRPKAELSKMEFMVAPAYARFAHPWNKIRSLRFQGLFASPKISADTVFETSGLEVLGTLVYGGVQSNIHFSCDSICVNTDEGHIEMVWRARFPWDLMGEQVGVLYLGNPIWA